MKDEGSEFRLFTIGFWLLYERLTMTSDFLPISKQDMKDRGWDTCDFIFITGDAYVDHPAFGPAIITRVVESKGFRIGVIAQPNWRTDEDFKKLGTPKYGFMISSGNIDSMVAHYTASKKKRSDDAYSPGKKPGRRPDRAVIVYCNKIRQLYGDIPIIIGGLEASLRRFAHYDYWDDKVRRSILFDCRADILVFGMGEHAISEIVNRLRSGEKIGELKNIRGTCITGNEEDLPENAVFCPSFESVSKFTREYANATRIQYEESDAVTGKTVVQQHGDKYLIQYPPSPAVSQAEFDRIYALPYTRTYHPVYEKEGGVPAIEEVEFSITRNRGCFGGCNFCSLAFHQGRQVVSRSDKSVINEARGFLHNRNFKGYIHDVGGPTANFTGPSCEKQIKHGLCKNKRCLAPTACPSLKVSHREYLKLLRELREIPGIKKVFIRSGIRFDYLMQDKDDTFFRELVQHHISGQLKVAPEHCSDRVLKQMGKPPFRVYREFYDKYYALNKRYDKKQFLVPYLMSSHPGSTVTDAVMLAQYLKETGCSPEQVQDFYPTPGTISTCMFYTGLNPLTMEKVYVPKSAKEKAMQRALLQFRNPKNHDLVIEALRSAGREDLIGFGKNCLVRPDTAQNRPNSKKGKPIHDKKFNAPRGGHGR